MPRITKSIDLYTKVTNIILSGNTAKSKISVLLVDSEKKLYICENCTYKQQQKSMNTKWKIALLTILGFSTAACCGTKKATKSEDKAPNNIEAEEEDPRIMLMYGVPFPDGEVARPVEEPETDAKEFPNGSVAKPVTEEEVQQKLEAIKAEKEAKAAAEEANE